MTKELHPSTPEGEDKLNEIIDSYFNQTKNGENDRQYSPEEIGGFKPIGVYSDGSPRYYGNKEETFYEEIDYSKELSKAIINNDSKEVSYLTEQGLIPQKKHLKLIQDMKDNNISVEPEIEKAIKENLPQQNKGIRI